MPIPLREETGFGFDMERFEAKVSKKTRLIIINSPENPTGGVLAPEEIGRIAEIARHYQVPVLSDEIYWRFIYEGEFASIARFPGMKERTIILDGFSKTYAMTGWRLGYGVMPAPLAEHLTRLMTNSASCTATFIQHAGIAALQGDDTPVQEMVAEFRQRRDLVVDGLNRIPGVSCQRPRGAFYVFPNVKSLRPTLQGDRDLPPRRGRGGRAGRDRVRRVRRGLPAALLRRVPGDDPGGARPDRQGPGPAGSLIEPAGRAA